MGRAYFAQSNGDEEDHAGRIYSLASFLIAAGDNSLFNYNPAPAANYFLVYRFPEWDIDLGRPLVQYEHLDEALLDGTDNVYVRRFERGMTLVNPTDTAASDIPVPVGAGRLVLSPSAGDPDGGLTTEPVGPAMILAPRTGEVLVYV